MKFASVFTMSLICMFQAVSLRGQSAAPGYLGKRVMVEYSLATWSPIYLDNGFLGKLSNYKGNKLGWPDDKAYFRSRHMAGMSLCLSRRSMVGANVSWQQAGYYSGYFSFSDNFVDTLGQIRVPGVEVLWRSFYFLRRGNIAPVGPYSEFGYGLMFPALRPIGTPGGAPVVRKMYGTFAMRGGYTAALANRLLFSFGMELQLPLFNKTFHPLTVSARDEGDEGVLFDAMSRLTSLNFKFSLQGLLF